MANVSLFGNKNGIQMTVGRAITSGATAANSTNIVSNTSPVVLPITNTGIANFMAALPKQGDTADHLNINGFALDAPGTHAAVYYTIWMSSSSANDNYNTMTATLTVLKVQM